MKSLLIAVALMIAVGAQAKKKSAPAEPAVEQDQVYSVPMGQAQVHIEPLEQEIKQKSVDYEFLLSSWQPGNLSRPSQVPVTHDFAVNGFPEASFNRVAVWKNLETGYLESVLGFSYVQLQRAGSLTVNASSAAVLENMYLLSLRAGAAYRFATLWSSRLQPSIGVALLPSWLGAAQSSMESSGVSAFGLPVEMSLELMYSPDFMRGRMFSSGGGFGLGAHSVFGTVGAASVAGTGADAIVRYMF